ncbi:ComEC/Rec2 family competence protein [Gordonia shandongensis]|uniref:ComEC/Rec2 family competence protein n=1 Tax=Gordonia shandongensis TaxID=376351 RepID=UPI00041818A7|nr:ComEC/Rec2 family competence protein [Gordonia shandongensis]
MRSTDLRLVAPAAACWGAVAFALAVPVTAGVGVIIVLGLGALVAGAAAGVRTTGGPPTGARRAPSRGAGTWAARWVTVAAVCGIAAAATLSVVLRIAVVESSPVAAVDGRPVVEVEVTGDPYRLVNDRMLVPVSVHAVDGAGVRPVDAVLIATSTAADPLPGERFRVRVRGRPPREGVADRLQAAQLSAVAEPVRIRSAPWWQRAAGRVRERLRETATRALGERAAGLLPGLILGDTSGLDQQTSDRFRAAGLTHLVAVSGSNFTLICGAVILCVRMTGASPRIVVAVGAVAIVGFVILVRPTDSVLRAAVMGAVGLAAGLGSRRAQALPALGTAVIVVVLVWPQMALAPGFALSVAATLGLVLWAAPIRATLMRWRFPEWLAVLVAMTVAAQVITTPLLIVFSGRVTVMSLPANVLAVPVVGIIGILGTAAAVIGALGSRYGPGAVLSELLVRGAGPPTQWLIGVADRLGGAAWSSVRVPGPVAAAVVVALLLLGRWLMGAVHR